MIQNISQIPEGILESSWTAAAVYAKMGDRPFYVRRFDPGNEQKTYVFFGEIVLPLYLAMPVMIRMYRSNLVIGKSKDKLYLALRQYLGPETFEFKSGLGFKQGEVMVISGYAGGHKPDPDSYYGIREYVNSRIGEGEKILDQFMQALIKP